MTVPTFTRDEHGIPHVEAADESALFFGQGLAHATDRALQMLLMRIVGQGRVSEILDSSDESLRVDRFFRRANWSAHTQPPLEQLSPIERSLLQAYCDGVNHALARRVPWEFRLCRHRPEPWKPEDTVLLLRMIGYLTLAASQGEMERLLVEMVQAGVEEEKLQELFPGILGGLDVELIKRVKLGSRIIPSDFWGTAMPRLMASNNWVVPGNKTVSRKPILSNDPHLEGNRLPAVWCEMSLRCGERYLLGGSIPGIPGVLSGRNHDLAWGGTYAFADAQDSWIEQCRDGKCYREDPDRWVEFRRRHAVIKRKQKPAAELLFFENEHGVLDGDPHVEGDYLATRWAPADLPRLVNPPEGFFATANEDLNRFGLCTPINLPMGPYRGDRIRQLLATRDNFTVADMCKMHFDVHSRQAGLFMNVLGPLLPGTPEAERLGKWDLKYTADSEGAYLFERFYEQLYREVFGQGGLGERAVDALRQQTGAFIDFYHNFDRVLLSDESVWFGGRSRNEIFRQAATAALRTPPQEWGKVQRFEMTNLFFGGRLPRFLGFDHGPFTAIGNRATIHQDLNARRC